ITSSVAVSSLWPPNGKFVNVGLSAGVTDNCPSPSLSVSVFSNEAGQAIHLAPGSLELASKRDGGGGGRVYLIVVRATDALNYSAISCNTVTVPHDQSAGSKNDVTAQAAAAQSFCSLHGGAAPNGYSLTQ
ncbi:MAG: hypothetical protein ACXVJT_17435, partial [Thermoanaerobaculia bacterium]